MFSDNWKMSATTHWDVFFAQKKQNLSSIRGTDYANFRKCNLQLTKLWVWLKCKAWDKNITGWWMWYERGEYLNFLASNSNENSIIYNCGCTIGYLMLTSNWIELLEVQRLYSLNKVAHLLIIFLFSEVYQFQPRNFLVQ